jgi:hypothetical protein
MTMDDPFSSKTTEVMVTTEINNDEGIDLATLEPNGSASSSSQPPPAAYSITISSTSPNQRHSYNEFSHTAQPNVTVDAPPTRQGAGPQRRRANFEANNAAWSYTKCAILFFTAILITWIPSSANRVYSVIHSSEISVPLEFMSALVLPLQGFWNAVIYITTSWSACKYFFSEMMHSSRATDTSKFTGDFNDMRNAGFKKMPARGSNKNYDTESMAELAQTTRPNSNDQLEERKPE